MRQQVVLKVVKQVIKKTLQVLLAFAESQQRVQKEIDAKRRKGKYVWSYAQHKYVPRHTNMGKD